MGFSRQEYWSGLPFPPLGHLPDPGVKPMSPAAPVLQADSLAESPRKPWFGHRQPWLICDIFSLVHTQAAFCFCIIFYVASVCVCVW